MDIMKNTIMNSHDLLLCHEVIAISAIDNAVKILMLNAIVKSVRATRRIELYLTLPKERLSLNIGRLRGFSQGSVPKISAGHSQVRGFVAPFSLISLFHFT